ncbi:MAG: TonB-dependent receptor [Muribaculaceae bacterium]|nr:TonB-dependent receptor [Muribaculaceae bacterium]
MKQLIKHSRLMLLVASLVMSTIASYAQSSFKVSGQVTDEEGEALIGVTVKVEGGKKHATMTDADGKYAITLSGPGTLAFEYVGMSPEKIKVTSAGTYNVTMRTSNTALDDVVVVGYGVQKKINLTGAVQSVTSEEILRRNVSNGSSALQGLVPGLTAIQGGGAPGGDQASIRIRGLGSMNSTQSPLVLIDGVEGDFNRIDLNQVESISVLKDGASASIYGSRASNGVILVTTKRGAEGKIKVTFNGYVGINKPSTMPKPVDAVGYLRAIDQANINNDQDPVNTDLINAYLTEGADNITRYDTDWRDLIMKKSALAQNYSVSVSGGNKSARVFASAGYYKQDGMVANNQFERTSLRLNSDLTVNRWLDLGVDLSVRQSVVDNPIGGSTTLIGYAMTFTPVLSAINNDGTWGYGLQGNNPIAAINDGGHSHSIAPEYIARLNATIKPFKGMTIVGNYTWKHNDGQTKTFANTYKEYEGGAYMGTYPSANKAASEERSSASLKQYNVTATYENTFAEKHYLKLMAGFQSEELNSSTLSGKRQKYYYDGYEDLVHGDATTATNSTYRYSTSKLGYVFRVNYIYNNRYLIELSGRYDGTSRFLPGKRWGFFPSASAGWRISEESFWEPLRTTVDNLKIRASYGKLGNQDLDGTYFPYVSAISPDNTSNSLGYWFDKTYYPGVAQTQLANTHITWEKSYQRNFGLDFGLFGSRLTCSFDFYYRYIDDMLQKFTLPEFVAMTAPWQNAGSMRNQGWELSISWADRVGEVSYYVKGNLSDTRNKIKKLYSNENRSGNSIKAEGYSLSNYFGYVADGYFQSYDEINAVDENNPVREDGTPNYIYAVYGERSNVKPGFIRYRDLDGNGSITSEDRKVIGDSRPHFEYGLTFGLEWKGIDFSAMLHGVGQKDVYYSGGGAKPLVGNATIYEHQLDSWSEDNRDAQYPLLLQDPNGNHQNNLFSSFWVKNGAYCRLKNVTVGYTLPRQWTRKATIERVRVYASAQNLFTLRASNFYKGFDPETSSGASCYPLNKTFLFGVNLEF